MDSGMMREKLSELSGKSQVYKLLERVKKCALNLDARASNLQNRLAPISVTRIMPSAQDAETPKEMSAFAQDLTEIYKILDGVDLRLSTITESLEI